jgi:hypothetical protein
LQYHSCNHFNKHWHFVWLALAMLPPADTIEALTARIAQLEAELAGAREALAGIANRINVVGSPWQGV